MLFNAKLITRILISSSFFASIALADLVPATPFEIDMSGTGFGNVSTLITLQTKNGQTTAEAGCIGFGDLTTNCGIAQVGKIKNSSSTEPVPAGITSAADLRFIFNPAQPSGGSFVIDQLQVSFYGTSDTPLFTAILPNPITLTSTTAGTGTSGFVFQIAANELAAADAALPSTTAIGAGFSSNTGSGGQDTLFLATVPTTIPEPASLLLLGSVVAVVCRLRHKRRTA